VIYIGTVSKTLSPELRIGYVVGPDTLIGVVATAKQLAGWHNGQMEQEALADLIKSGTMSATSGGSARKIITT